MSRHPKCVPPPACPSPLEHERLRIACQLHDHAGQHLALAQLRLAELGEQVAASDVKPLVEEVQALIREASSSLRRVLHDLGNQAPPPLEQGLARLVREVGARFPDAVPITLELQHLHSPLPPDTTKALLRMAEELLSNVRKHSGATQATLRCTYQDRQLTLSVEDNGCGFPPGVRGSSRGFGLCSIALQLKALQGSLVLDGNAGQGARVHLLVPGQPLGRAARGAS